MNQHPDPEGTNDAIPYRGPDYGSQVWARLQPLLPPGKAPSRSRWWILAPALAASLALVFLAGMLTQKHRVPATAIVPGNRVLYLSLSDHLQQAQTMLTAVAHADPNSINTAQQRTRARDLILQNRILRQRARRAGDATDAAVLEDLERVLLEVANTDRTLEALQQRMEDGNLLFRVRISGAGARMKGEKL